jgi:hypothetical protein
VAQRRGRLAVHPLGTPGLAWNVLAFTSRPRHHDTPVVGSGCGGSAPSGGGHRREPLQRRACLAGQSKESPIQRHDANGLNARNRDGQLLPGDAVKHSHGRKFKVWHSRSSSALSARPVPPQACKRPSMHRGRREPRSCSASGRLRLFRLKRHSMRQRSGMTPEGARSGASCHPRCERDG